MSTIEYVPNVANMFFANVFSETNILYMLWYGICSFAVLYLCICVAKHWQAHTYKWAAQYKLCCCEHECVSVAFSAKQRQYRKVVSNHFRKWYYTYIRNWQRLLSIVHIGNENGNIDSGVGRINIFFFNFDVNMFIKLVRLLLYDLLIHNFTASITSHYQNKYAPSIDYCDDTY